MKKNFEIPEMIISQFNAEDIVTGSAVVTSVKEKLISTENNGALTLDGKSGSDVTNILTFTW